ncbi:dehydrodolichyl diphosphate synthase CPT3-like [Vicia villosa]|uniref:dehydrodolichyl diphosphate synthase CPT3-like n=1 Tax=Vicia villosa TaxID=3911 RepID=UPI00273ABD2B|nr:dehydrodolichyl diphosphate synthase CPT3-like [Vicia villosa]XP_058767490.1 dehydrodolichyl diphosphate synthase CPT3-like [Vicia villosa]XP_058767494.1 dehydrodolichyl diphosphate synthase CPT3-like [Vicia villosa]XP_058767496.1 dehydrodolichyl diphosphate synthase CPT3-like [Vicia villosa]XP_058767502.1 dehydrodolichyl diphosphate synthase CPT3-like [Vicia villosa]
MQKSAGVQKSVGGITRHLLGGLCYYLRRCIFSVLSVGPVPSHISFIMDGNRRYAKRRNLGEGDGHKAGFSALLSILRYCYELGIKYVSVYAFSIDNFKRKPEEVQTFMELMREKIEELLQQESIINEYGVRLHFIGNMQLLTEPVRVAAEKAMRVTAHNQERVLLICVAYTSRDEIVHAVQESCKDKWNEFQASMEDKVSNGGFTRINQGPKSNGIDLHVRDSYKEKETKACRSLLEEVEGAEEKDYSFEQNLEKHSDNYSEDEITSCSGMDEITEERKYKQGEFASIKLVDIEKHMYMSVAPDPDILIRTSGEARLSNFLLWQTSACPLYAPKVLWPEIGLRHLVWAVLNFQRHHFYLEKKKKQF